MNAAETGSDRRAMRGAAVVLSGILSDLVRDGAAPAAAGQDTAADPQARLGDIVDRLDERAFGFLMLFLALPCCLPFVYVLPQIVALPMLALAGQLAAGRRHPWLPRSLNERRFSAPAFQKVVARSAKYIGWIERLARPRLLPVTGHFGVRLVGVLLIVPCASILLPLPSTNTVPGIGVAMASLGIIERDGALVIFGLAIGFAWVGLLLILGFEAASLIRAWLEARI